MGAAALSLRLHISSWGRCAKAAGSVAALVCLHQQQHSHSSKLQLHVKQSSNLKPAKAVEQRWTLAWMHCRTNRAATSKLALGCLQALPVGLAFTLCFPFICIKHQIQGLAGLLSSCCTLHTGTSAHSSLMSDYGQLAHCDSITLHAGGERKEKVYAGLRKPATLLAGSLWLSLYLCIADMAATAHAHLAALCI